tara:strand:+ start:1100 stop:1831 length:732 start_codon:yes stop_codon:yes gene_type:complete
MTKSKIQVIKVDKLKPNKANPRKINKDKFKKLVTSIKKFPKMLDIRPIVVDENMTILGGNMRYKACLDIGIKEVPVIVVNGLSNDEADQFIIKDNVGYGEWAWETLADEWDVVKLKDWGLDLPIKAELSDEEYSTKVDSPIYETKALKPTENELYDLSKYNELVEDIEKSNVSKEEKTFLKLSATRHIKFNYSKIADYYAHSEEGTQELIEDSALVIIDYDKAIEKGFVEVYRNIENLSLIDE